MLATLLVANCTLPGVIKPYDYDATKAIQLKKDWQVLNASTDSWRLALSYSSNFCKNVKGAIPRKYHHQCKDNQFGLVVHGLWAQSRDAKNYKEHPRNCHDTIAITPTVLSKYLCMIPGVELIQKEWEKHGSCDFDNAKLYLAQTKALFSKLKLPSHDVLRQLHKKSYHAIKSAIVNLNTSIGLKEKHIWIVKKRGELREVHLCYNKDFTLKACR